MKKIFTCTDAVLYLMLTKKSSAKHTHTHCTYQPTNQPTYQDKLAHSEAIHTNKGVYITDREDLQLRLVTGFLMLAALNVFWGEKKAIEKYKLA